jgi:hypothetical protein
MQRGLWFLSCEDPPVLKSLILDFTFPFYISPIFDQVNEKNGSE